MNWSDLEQVDADKKVARLSKAGDLLVSGQIALIPAGTTPPPLRDGIWVTLKPMTETVKRVDDAALVLQTVPREQLRVVTFPAVVPASLARRAADPQDLLRHAVETGRARALPVD